MSTIKQRAETADIALALLYWLRGTVNDPKTFASVTAGQIEDSFFEHLNIDPTYDPRQLEAGPALAMRCLHQASLVSMGKAKDGDKLPPPERMKPIIPIRAKLSMTSALTLLDTAIFLARREGA